MRKIFIALLFLTAGMLWAQEDPFQGKAFYDCVEFGLYSDRGVHAGFLGRDTFQTNGTLHSQELDERTGELSEDFKVQKYTLTWDWDQLFITTGGNTFWVCKVGPGIFVLVKREESRFGGFVYPLQSSQRFLVEVDTPGVTFSPDKLPGY